MGLAVTLLCICEHTVVLTWLSRLAPSYHMLVVNLPQASLYAKRIEHLTLNCEQKTGFTLCAWSKFSSASWQFTPRLYGIQVNGTLNLEPQLWNLNNLQYQLCDLQLVRFFKSTLTKFSYVSRRVLHALHDFFKIVFFKFYRISLDT